MKLGLLLVILGVILVLWCVLSKKYNEPFMSDQLSLTVSWSPPSGYPQPQNLSYQWAVCNSEGCDPTQLQPMTTTATSVVLNDQNCPGCDFGQTLSFAVRAVDTTTSLASTWALLSISLIPTNTPADADVYFEDDTSGQAPTAGSQGMYASMNATSDCQAGCSGEVVVTVQRGSSTYEIVAFSDAISQSSGVSVDVSFSNTSWSPSPPGPLQSGDVVTGYFLLYSSDSVMMYAVIPYTASDVTPGPVSGLQWSI